MNNFAEYLFYSILESAQEDGELPIYFSDNLRAIIEEIEEETGNEVARRLSWEEGKNSKRIFVDLDQDSNDKVTFLMANKAEEILSRKDKLKYLKPDEYDAIWKARQRGSMKINRFVNALFDNEFQTKKLTPEERDSNREKGIKTPSQHLEDFVNQFKAIREPGKFVLVKGTEIPHWYSENQYESDKGTLGGSCMMYDECEDYLQFYADNPHKISMLIMKSKDNEHDIRGRAIVWKLDTPSDRIFMDRVYTNYDHDVENFKKYAKDNDWLYKFKQNMESTEKIVDTVNDTIGNITMVVKDIQEGYTDEYEERPSFPYLDTMKFYSPGSKMISNTIDGIPSNGSIYKLSGTEGTDYQRLNNRSLEELREMYKEEILGDIKYAVIEMFPDMFWNFIDDDKYVQSFIDGEVSYYLEDFENIFEDEDDLIQLIKSNVSDENKIPKNINDMDIGELHELTDKLNIRAEIAREYAEDRYKNYTAKEIYDELYGLRNGIDNDIYNQLEYYFDEDGFAEEVANMESEEDLRERFPDDDD